jgi:hypothetical protein
MISIIIITIITITAILLDSITFHRASSLREPKSIYICPLFCTYSLSTRLQIVLLRGLCHCRSKNLSPMQTWQLCDGNKLLFFRTSNEYSAVAVLKNAHQTLHDVSVCFVRFLFTHTSELVALSNNRRWLVSPPSPLVIHTTYYAEVHPYRARAQVRTSTLRTKEDINVRLLPSLHFLSTELKRVESDACLCSSNFYHCFGWIAAPRGSAKIPLSISM